MEFLGPFLANVVVYPVLLLKALLLHPQKARRVLLALGLVVRSVSNLLVILLLGHDSCGVSLQDFFLICELLPLLEFHVVVFHTL